MPTLTPHSNGTIWLLMGVGIIAGAGLLLVPPDSPDERAPIRAGLTIGPPLATPRPKPPPHLGVARLDEERGRWVAAFGEGQATLTLVPALQQALSHELSTNHVQRGGTVLLEASTGRVLALASHQEGTTTTDAPARVAFAPAASIAKLPAVAALLRQGVRPAERVCYAGGKRRLKVTHLDDNPARDRRCVTLEDIIPFSVNAALAKLVDRHLPSGVLQEELRRWNFNRRIPFAWPVEVSLAPVPTDRFGHAKAAAGFGEVLLSPLHGAVMASIVANGGLLVPPRVIDHVDGEAPPAPASSERAVDKDVAAQLKRMMRRTVREGTGVRAFSLANSSLRRVEVAGKTGSLTDYDGGADYTWFVGFAPTNKPEVIVAAAVENDIMLWHTRAPDVAREALEAYFAHRDDVVRLR